MADRLETLAAIEAGLWRELLAAPRDKQHAWRTPVLATTDGTLADARTVILRDVDAKLRTLTLYSDIRAGKVAQLRSHPVGSLVLWSSALAWQLRMRVQLEAESDGLAVSSLWARLKFSAAASDYLSLHAPGSELAAPAGARGERAHFAVITASVLSVDWLELHADGHRRALFGLGAPRWLQP